MEHFERNTDFYYLYLHHYANTNIKFVAYELNIYDAISELLGIPEFDHNYLNQHNTESCVLTEIKIVKKFITKCNHCIEECAMIDRSRIGLNTCPVCGHVLFDVNDLKQLMTNMSDMWFYCDTFDNDDNDHDHEHEELAHAKEQFIENYLEFISWLN
jgi:Zn-finger nucleic acid-binding protein